MEKILFFSILLLLCSCNQMQEQIELARQKASEAIGNEDEEFQDCEGLKHGEREERIRFKTDKVISGICEKEDQVRSCNNGKLSVWSGSFTFVSCKTCNYETQTSLISNDNNEMTILPYKGEIDSITNYSYTSASTHPINGPIPREYEMHIFLYEGSDGLSLNFYQHADNSGGKKLYTKWRIRTSQNNLADEVIFSDDKGELREVMRNPELQTKEYRARFRYGKNTDGGIIGPFTGLAFKVEIELERYIPNENLIIFSSDGNELSYDLRVFNPKITIKREQRLKCQTTSLE